MKLPRTVRVKNKYLLVLGICLVLVLGWVQANEGALLYQLAEKARQDNQPAKALAYYDKLITEHPENPSVPDALYWSITLLPQDTDFQAVIFSRHSSTSHRDNVVAELDDTVLTREQRLWRLYEDYPDHWSSHHVPFMLGSLLLEQNDPQAEELLLQALHTENGSRRADAALLLVDLYMQQSKYHQAMAIIEYCQSEIPNHQAVWIQFIKGDILAALGEPDQAIDAYNQVFTVFAEEIRLWEDRRDRYPDLQEPAWDHTRHHYEEMIAARIMQLPSSDQSNKMARVTGQVTLAGEPLAGFRVIVNRIQSSGHFRSTRDENELVQFTNEQGYFQFSLPVGVQYETGVQLNYQQGQMVEGYHLQIINGDFMLSEDNHTVEFRFVPPVVVTSPEPEDDFQLPLVIKWEPYPGADSYRVGISSVELTDGGYRTLGGPIIDNISEVEYAFVEMPKPQFGSFGADQRGVFPAYFIGYLQGADSILLRVYAVDAQGRILASNGGLYFGPGVDPEVTLNIGDVELDPISQLLLDRNYDQAITMLEQELEANPKDQQLLDILSRIYFSGTHNIGNDWQNEQMAHQDREKSAEILERLVEMNPSADNLSSLVLVYRALGRMDDVYPIFEQ